MAALQWLFWLPVLGGVVALVLLQAAYAGQPFKPHGWPAKLAVCVGVSVMMWPLLSLADTVAWLRPFLAFMVLWGVPWGLCWLVYRGTAAAIGEGEALRLALHPFGLPAGELPALARPPAPVRWRWAGLGLTPVAGLLGPYLVGLAVWGVIVWGVLALTRRRPDVEKVRPDLLADKAVREAVATVLNQPLGVLCGRLAGDDARPLRVGTDDRVCVVGPPGTGKTAFLVAQVLDWADSGRSFVCLDIKPEIYGIVREQLQAKGYRLFTFNPTARTGERYNMLADVDGPEGLGELVAALVQIEGADARTFQECARDLLDAVVSHLRTRGQAVALPDVLTFMGGFDGVRELLRELRTSPDADVRVIASALVLTAQNERLIGSVFTALRSSLRFLRYPAIRASLARSDFSLGELCGPRVGLFLQFEEAHRETTAGLFSAMLAHLLRYFIVHTRREAVLLLLDEIGNVPAVRGLVQKLNTVRSRNLPTWMYWQSREQMQPYGEKDDEGQSKILGACDLQIVFRLNDNESAAWMSEKIGTVDRMIKSVGVVCDGLIPTLNYSNSLVTEPLIYPHELQQLKTGETVCTWRGLSWRGHAAPYFDIIPALRGVRPSEDACRGSPYADQEAGEPAPAPV